MTMTGVQTATTMSPVLLLFEPPALTTSLPGGFAEFGFVDGVGVVDVGGSVVTIAIVDVDV